jgi:predicted O-methyltransferase YrrM
MDVVELQGTVSVKLATALYCNCYRIDGISEFIKKAKRKAKEYSVETLYRFEVSDIRKKIKELDKFDVIILGAIGPVFGNYYETLTTLSKHLAESGIIIINDAYIDDASTFQNLKNPTYSCILLRKELIKQVGQAEMKLIDEFVSKYSEHTDGAKEMENIVIRCNELKTKYPEKSSLFEKYAQDQIDGYDDLENEVIGSVMVLKSV